VAEGEALLEKLRGTCAGGCTILLIEHNMRVMQAISDFVVVINFGEKLLSGTPDEIKNDKKVIEVYLGEELANA
jgi:ABC-type branched-subunit amino acid transport system ATPase component